MGIHELLLPLKPKPPAPTPSLGARTHHTPAQGNQPHSAFAESSETQIFHSPSTWLLPRAGVGQLSPLTACPPARLRQAAAGGCTDPSWVGGHHHPQGACFGEQGPLLPPSFLFINSWLMSPSSLQKRLIQSDSKDESGSKPGREQWGNV